ncbi:right-handed parallel beta-helix repeat-containing protein [Clostridium estertheticum]|uniref:right-handed parallel beta-helix repeat-containing protein n=1 Tax=Clostridium estertheticum TaxID=238834 RepID=UPI001CF3FFF8|nr:right-handed parallel beta-helix repeat-containing protein [Clostridium estertheticum]MCB2354984.1 right-handed parallel beta-helix repeat-containing protein [Clostridium estertheticum]WAG41935.1 right-handed parallel beta-helix repeat-containing protein [Clostridium estertheticum]
MQRLKNLCMVAALGAIVMGGCLLQSTSASAASIINVKAGGNTLSSALASAKSGDTIAISGTVTSGSVVVPAGVTISGTAGKGVINFSSSTGRGLTINTKGSTIKDLELYGAADNGIYMEGSGNNLINLKVHGNHDAGVQLSNGAANNTLTKVNSYSNADAKGENADGFAIKLHSGAGNTLTDCTAEGNSDDGYDLYAAHGAVTFTRCKAINNGNCGGIKGDGNGFKVGGVDNKTPGVAAHLDPLKHVLIDCTATGNTGSGFDRNNQNGVVTMTGCIGQKNGKNNFNFPLTGAPSALGGTTVTFGVAIMTKCTSIAGTNNITGAKLSGCIGF